MNPGLSDLATLLSSLEPTLHDGAYAWCLVPPGTDTTTLAPVATMTEAEGVTVIVPEAVAASAGLEVRFRSAWLSLTVHSDLQAVGLTAAFSDAFARAGLSCNVVAGVFHDHVFVPFEEGARALEVLRALQRDAARRLTTPVYAATFTFAAGQYDEDFHRLDDEIAQAARALPGYLGEEAWQDPARGLVANVYYWSSLEALQALIDLPAHGRAKASQARWLAGYRVEVAQVLRAYGDGRIGGFPGAKPA